MEQVRVAFVGVGGVASLHLEHLHENEYAAIVAVCDIHEPTVNSKAEQFGVAAYTDVDKMLEQEEIDALFVCVPPWAHGDIEEKAARRGIHLLVEKPLGLDLESVHKKAKVLRATGIIAASGYCLRYLDTVARAKQYLEDKKVAMARGYYLTQFVPTPWYREQEKSGGQLVEQSTHIVDLARYLAGDIEQVYANMSLQVMKDIPNISIPDVTSLNIVFESGAVGHIDSTFIQPDHRSGIELMGRDFRVSIDGLSVTIVDQDYSESYTTKMDFYEEQSRVFIEAVRTGNPDLILASYDEGLTTLAVTLAANESAQSGKAVDLASFVHTASSV